MRKSLVRRSPLDPSRRNAFPRATLNFLARHIHSSSSLYSGEYPTRPAKASDTHSEWIANMKSSRHIENDRADLSRFKQLYYTLPTRLSHIDSQPCSGQPVSPGHHLILFPPLIPETKLNADGTDPTYNSPPPYTRRMWASGRMMFDPRHQIRIDENVTCETAVESVEKKNHIVRGCYDIRKPIENDQESTG